MTPALWLPLISLSKTWTLRLAMTMTPVPVGTPATMLPLGAKLGVSLSTIRLRKTRVEWPPICGRLGRSKTRTPPALRVATLSWTSANMEFSISIPATLNSARLLRTTMCLDWPT